MKKKRNLKENRITLMALIITIIVLLILAGIAIEQLTEREILEKTRLSKNTYEISEAKEQLEFAITGLKIEEEEKGDTLTKEDLIKLNNDKIDVKSIESFPVEIIYENYKFCVDEQFVVTYVGEANETIITYTTNPKGYTNQDNIELTLKISNKKGIKKIEFTDGLTIECNGKTKCAKDLSSIVNGTHTYKVTDMEENETIKEILIEQIDRLAPLDFTPTVIDAGSQFLKISVNVEDADATTENTKSGIEKYEYYIKENSENKYRKYSSEENNYTFTKLSKNTQYSIYVIAYDKAGNSKETEPIITSTHNNVSLEKILLTKSGFVNCYDKNPITNEIERYILDKSIPYESTTFQGRWAWITVSWGLDTYYNNLYNAFDGNISTYAGFARSGIDGSNVADRGGYVFVEDDCIGKCLNVYDSSSNVKFIFRNANFDEISSNLINTSSKKNKISSMLIPENTEFIEMYYTGQMTGGVRGMVYEIFLTDTEVQDTQNINEFFNN